MDNAGSNTPIRHIMRTRIVWEHAIKEAEDSPARSWVGAMYSRVKRAAQQRGIGFEITKDELLEILRRCGGYCELTGIPLQDRKPEGARTNWFAPSLDRIDSSAPYRADNCRIVCVAMNVALGDWGESIFRLLAEGYCCKAGKLKESVSRKITDDVIVMCAGGSRKRP